MPALNKESDFVFKLLIWFNENQRFMPWRETKDPYKIWLSEVMLQQTQVDTVIPYYNRFIEQYPDPESLASAHDDDVLKLWEGLGYYRRCHNFIQAVRDVNTQYDGKVPDDPNHFKQLPGVGDYTTAAVMSIAYNHVLPVVDGNVIRVITRFYMISDDVGKAATKKNILDRMTRLIPGDTPGDFNQAVMELGALVCTPKNPRCDECPISEYCGARQTQTTVLYPVISKKQKIPEYQVGLGLIVRDGQFLIQKRPSTGHLAGLWELPGGKASQDETPVQALKRKCLEELGLDVNVYYKTAEASHVYSHFKIRVSVHICHIDQQKEVALKNQPLAWIYPQEHSLYAFPGVNHKLFEKIFPKNLCDFGFFS